MRLLSYDTLEKTARKVTSQAYLRGKMSEAERQRTAPRDATKSAVLAHMASVRIRRNPMRKNPDGTISIPFLLS